MERFLRLFGYSVQRITCGMRDVQQVEVAPTISGDVPNSSEDIVNALPDIPDSDTPIEAEKVD